MKSIHILMNRDNLDIFQDHRMMVGHHENYKEVRPRYKALTIVDVIKNRKKS